MRILLIVIVIGICLSACMDLKEQQANHEKMRDGLKKHEIRRVTEEEILAAVFHLGDSLISSLSGEAVQHQTYWLSDAGASRIDSFNQVHIGSSLKFITAIGNNESSASTLELQLLEAYAYSHERDQVLNNNVQILDDNLVLFTAPLVSQDTLQGIWSLTKKKSSIVLDF